MAITNGYCTLAEMKARLDIATGTTSSDTIIENIIEATSRAIDALVLRRFYASTETRYFWAHDATYLYVGDLLSVTTLKTDSNADRSYDTTWGVTDYDLLPVNAPSDGWPYDRIAVAPGGRYLFPTGARNQKAIQIAGSFGFASTTPDAVNEACLIASAQMFMRKDSPFGVSGGSGFVQTMKQVLRHDPHVWALLSQYQRYL